MGRLDASIAVIRVDGGAKRLEEVGTPRCGKRVLSRYSLCVNEQTNAAGVVGGAAGRVAKEEYFLGGKRALQQQE